MHIPGVVLSIKCKEQWGHGTVTFVEQREVGLDGEQLHEDQMAIVNKGHPEGCCFPQVAFEYLVLICMILFNESYSRGVIEGSVEVNSITRLGDIEKGFRVSYGSVFLLNELLH